MMLNRLVVACRSRSRNRTGKSTHTGMAVVAEAVGVMVEVIVGMARVGGGIAVQSKSQGYWKIGKTCLR